MQTATTEAAAHAQFQAERTGQPNALPTAEGRALVAAFFARNRAANGYANQLAADYARLTPAEQAAEVDRNEIGYAATL